MAGSQRSIAVKLGCSLLLVGSIGLVVLLGAIVLDYHITFTALKQPRALTRALHEVSAHMLLPALVIAVPMGFAAFFSVRAALRPIHRAARMVEQTSLAAPGVRIDAHDFPAEIAPLAEGVNGLLARLEGLAERNAAFAADVAHELRTPLTVMGLELEQLKGADTASLQLEVRRMQKLVNQLMLIAQLDAQAPTKRLDQEVDLHAVALDVVAQMAPQALAAERMVELDDRGAASIAGQAEALAAALRNLVENALRVTPQGGAVTVIVGPGPVLAVADGGSGLDPEELTRLSDRHVRADKASRDGAGLGLAIVRKIVSAHGGSLTAEKEQARIVMRFPPLPGVR
jgi:signal transduction histidine kinase